MKNAFTKSAIVLAAALIAGAAFAADNGGLTREQVRAEYNQARANGTLPVNGEGQTAVAPKAATSALSREAVRADYYAARAAGTLPANGEGQEVRRQVRQEERQGTAPVAVSREAVKAEYYAARRAGTLPLNGERG